MAYFFNSVNIYSLARKTCNRLNTIIGSLKSSSKFIWEHRGERVQPVKGLRTSTKRR